MLNPDPAAWTWIACYYVGINEDAAEAFATDTYDAEMAMRKGARHPEAHSLHKNYVPKDEALTGVCDHCGASHAWGSVFQHTDGSLLAVGHVCAAKIFSLPDRASVKVKKAKARAAEIAAGRRILVRNLRAVVLRCRVTPALRAWWRSSDRFAKDLRAKAHLYKYTEGQLNAMQSAAMRADERATRRAENAVNDGKPQLNPALPCPAGRYDGTLALLHTKTVTHDFGECTKGLWQHPVEGWKAWFTVPSGVSGAYRGDVAVRVTLSPKQDDPCFAFGSRPTYKGKAG